MELMKEILKQKNYSPKKYKDPLVREGDDFGIIWFQSKICSYKEKTGGCTFCTLENRSFGDPNYEEQFEYAISQLKGQKKKNLLLFNRNFFDEKELPMDSRKNLLKMAKEYATERISIETRPEYITDKKMAEMRTILGDLEIDIYIGVESANDFIRKYNHHKGFSMRNVLKAKDIMDKWDANFLPFIFVKPYFMTERMALEDTKKSIEKMISLGAKDISIQPMHAFSNTLGDILIKDKRTSPPNLWTLHSIMKDTKDLSKIGIHAIDPNKLSPIPEYMPDSCPESKSILIDILTKKRPVEDAPETKSRTKWENQIKSEEGIHPADKLIEDLYFLKDKLKINAPVPEKEIWTDFEKYFHW